MRRFLSFAHSYETTKFNILSSNIIEIHSLLQENDQRKTQEAKLEAKKRQKEAELHKKTEGKLLLKLELYHFIFCAIFKAHVHNFEIYS